MNLYRLAALAAALAFAQSPARAAPVPQAQWPAEVREGHDGWAEQCRSSGGRLTAQADYVTSGDFNADGRPDYLIDDGALDCDGGSVEFCSAVGNCGVAILVSAGPGGRLVDTADIDNSGLMAPSAGIVREQGRDFVSVMSRHGTGSVLGWDGRTMREMSAAERRRLPRTTTGGATPAGPRWTSADGMATIRTGGSPVVEMVTSCVPGGPVLAIQFDRALPGATAEVTLSAGDMTQSLTMSRAGESLVWTARSVPIEVLDLLAGSASSLTVDVLRLSATVPLGGSTDAIRSTLAACWPGLSR